MDQNITTLFHAIDSIDKRTVHQHCHEQLTRTEDEFISVRHAPGRAWRSRCHGRGRGRGGSLLIVRGYSVLSFAFIEDNVVDVHTVPPEVTEGGAEA